MVIKELKTHFFDSLKNIITTALEEAEISNQEVTISLLNELYPL